jgi:hypothetical protein
MILQYQDIVLDEKDLETIFGLPKLSKLLLKLSKNYDLSNFMKILVLEGSKTHLSSV